MTAESEFKSFVYYRVVEMIFSCAVLGLPL